MATFNVGEHFTDRDKSTHVAPIRNYVFALELLKQVLQHAGLSPEYLQVQDAKLYDILDDYFANPKRRHQTIMSVFAHCFATWFNKIVQDSLPSRYQYTDNGKNSVLHIDLTLLRQETFPVNDHSPAWIRSDRVCTLMDTIIKYYSEARLQADLRKQILNVVRVTAYVPPLNTETHKLTKWIRTNYIQNSKDPGTHLAGELRAAVFDLHTTVTTQLIPTVQNHASRLDDHTTEIALLRRLITDSPATSVKVSPIMSPVSELQREITVAELEKLLTSPQKPPEAFTGNSLDEKNNDASLCDSLLSRLLLHDLMCCECLVLISHTLIPISIYSEYGIRCCD